MYCEGTAQPYVYFPYTYATVPPTTIGSTYSGIYPTPPAVSSYSFNYYVVGH
jgi:hypothetical protein